MRATISAVIILVLCAAIAPPAKSFDAQAVNDAEWEPSPRNKGTSPFLTKAQILLARARFSPGEIDGKPGENLDKAIAAFASGQGVEPGKLDQGLWEKLRSTSTEPVMTDHIISEEDIRGPFAEKIPAKMEEMSKLPTLAYSTAREKLAEKFHISPELLAALNPGKKFDSAGDKIVVPNLLRTDFPQKVARMEIDKTRQEQRAFDRNGKVLAYYPVTAGSEEKPAPDGTLK